MNAWSIVNEELNTYFPSTGRTLNFPIAVILALACQTADASEPQFQDDPIPHVPMGDPVVQSGTVPNGQETTPSVAAEPLCNHIEQMSCSTTESYIDSLEDRDCHSVDTCERAACYVRMFTGRQLECLRSICPSAYSSRYVACLDDLVTDEVECIQQQDDCNIDPVNLQLKCRLPSSKRHEYLLDCMQ